MDFDTFLNMFLDELIEMWKNSIHYITTDFGVFIELKYDAFNRRGSF
jgi:hypothetical protein